MSEYEKKHPKSKPQRESKKETFTTQEPKEERSYIGESKAEQDIIRKGSEIPPRPKKEK